MGDPKKTRKQYSTPSHPWVGPRILEENKLVQEYGLRNKKEVWKMASVISQFKDRAKKLIAKTDAQTEKERQQLLDRMARLGLIKRGASFDDILGLTVKSSLDRRLQTLLVKKHLARTMDQARQMVIHRHVTMNGVVVTSPGRLVTVEEEPTLAFTNRSAFFNEQHPERFSEEELSRKREAQDAARKRAEEAAKSKKEEVVAFREEEIKEAEVLAGEAVEKEVKEGDA